MTIYRTGIVGLSWITANPAGPGSHPVLGTTTPYSHASAFAAMPNVDVVAGCDISPSACTSFLERWQPVWPKVSTYSDYREMLQREEIDLLSVVTPDNLHADVVIAAIDAGVRAIFCEKPLETNLADADRMLAAIREHNVVVNVNHTRRWIPAYVAAREAVREGQIGDLTQVTVHFGGPRAMLWRNHSHFLDLICYFAEGNPEWVVAELEPGFEDYGTEYRGDGGRDPSLEPGVNAFIAFDNGVRAFLGGMKRATSELSVDLVGTTGRMRANDSLVTRTFSTEEGVVQQPIVPKGSRAGMHAAVADLIAALETGQPPQSPPEEARKTVALIQAILDSQAAGNARVAVR